MIESALDFKRMVLGLPHNATDYASVAFTAQLAEQLGIDIVGLFVEDENLTELAALSCVRELRSLGGGWHPINAAQMAQGVGQAVNEARRRFEAAAKAIHVGARFTCARGSIAEVVSSQSSVDDIIVVIEPKNPAERVTYQYRQMAEVAFNAPAAMLMVPSNISRKTGPVVAVATDLQDSSLHAALGVAISIKEKLVVFAPRIVGETAMRNWARASAVPVDWRPLPGGVPGALELMSLLSGVNERFLVLSRGEANGRLPSQLASGRGVPVLLTEPGKSEK